MGLVLRGLGPFKRYSSSIAGSSTKNPTQYYSERRVLGFSAAEMFTVVSQVERYDTFVPWCNKSTVIQKSNQGREVKAKLEIGFPSLMGITI